VNNLKEIIRDLITPNVDENMAYLKELLKDRDQRM
jgi:hypothetical protein